MRSIIGVSGVEVLDSAEDFARRPQGSLSRILLVATRCVSTYFARFAGVKESKGVLTGDTVRG